MRPEIPDDIESKIEGASEGYISPAEFVREAVREKIEVEEDPYPIDVTVQCPLTGESHTTTASRPTDTVACPGHEAPVDVAGGLRPGEFVRWFFTSHTTGVRSSYRRQLASWVESTGELPPPTTLEKRLKGGSSGLGTDDDISMVVEMYEGALSEAGIEPGSD